MKKYIIVSYDVKKKCVKAIVRRYPMDFGQAIRQIQKNSVCVPSSVLKLVEIDL